MVNLKTKLGGERALSRHILPTSATMIGICTTFIGLVKVAESKMGPSHVDEYAALAALLFLISAGSSYLSIRYSQHMRLGARYERVADMLFLGGLFSITFIAMLFAYEAI
ncbi:MAG: hypothetical protein NTZ72_13580 [Afipia sp.]|jgi:hypothetical protein|nr:hypothetical protein [Afipia sp.]